MAKRRKVDPRKVLEEIAADPAAPVVVRCRAARALLAADRQPTKAAATIADDDPVTRRALQIAAERQGRLLN